MIRIGIKMTDLGVARGRVELQNYQEKWKDYFLKEKQELEKIFDIKLSEFSIHHVGSTAVPGLIAKPIIDMLLVFDTDIYNYFYTLQEVLTTRNYHYRENGSNENKLFFARGNEDRRTHYLHITKKGSQTAEEMLHFRDRLRSHKKLRDEYADIKLKLKSQNSDDRAHYTASKHQFIQDVLKSR